MIEPRRSRHGASASIPKVTVTDAGAGAVADPASSTPVPASDDDAFQNPLVVSAAFGAINLNLGTVLQLPLATDMGVYGQYGRASGNASSAGATGAVTQGGAINLDVVSAPPEERPAFGTLHLGTVLEQALGGSLSTLVTANLADIRLNVGAVASAASIDGCAAVWGGVYDALARDYAIAGLDAELDSPLVGQLSGAVTSTLSALETELGELAGRQSLLNSLSAGILGAGGLGPLLATVTPGTPTVSLVLTPNFSAVNLLLDDTISDDDGIVQIDLATGMIRVDLEALLGASYGQVGLGGLPANTELLIDAPVINALALAIGSAIDGWIADVHQAIQAALDLVRVQLTLSVPLGATVLGVTAALGTLTVTADASLASLVDGSAVLNSGFTQAAGLCTILIAGPTLCGLVNTLLAGLTPAALSALGPVIGGILTPAITGVATPLLTTLGSTLAALAASNVTLLAETLGGLFGSSGLVGLLANVQNDPDPAEAGAGPEPSAWSSLPGPTNGYPASTGQYDVAALRLSVLGVLPALTVAVELARSTVGSNVVTG
jgi:hypothetical protein